MATPELCFSYLAGRWNVLVVSGANPATGRISTQFVADRTLGYDVSTLPLHLHYDATLNMFFASEDVYKDFLNTLGLKAGSRRGISETRSYLAGVEEVDYARFVARTGIRDLRTIGFGRSTKVPWITFNDLIQQSQQILDRYGNHLQRIEDRIEQLLKNPAPAPAPAPEPPPPTDLLRGGVAEQSGAALRQRGGVA